jgi:WD40 repeat protein
LDELALRVAPLAGADAAAVRRGLDADPVGFALTARQAAQAQPPGPTLDLDRSGGRNQPSQQQQRLLVVVVDQFEELFTQCADESQRRAFISALHAAATTGHGPDRAPAALVVLGVRSDFEAHCADYPQLAGAVQDRYLVTAMTERQLRMAITEPAKKAGCPVDDDLVGVLLGEVRNGQPGMFAAGVLPLLSHALDQAWRSGTGTAVTLADYERTGGIEGAVAASAQRAYDTLTSAQQATARQVFIRLTATSTEGTDSADRATRADLTAGKTTAEAADVNQVLEAFVAERLLTLAAGTVELSHEILLTAWPLLRDTWLADTHADRIVRTRLAHTAAEWDHHARDPSYLYTGSLLQAATATTARITADPARHPSLGQAERDFLHASEQAHRGRVRGRQAVIAGLLVLTLAAVTAAGIAAHNAAAAAHNAAVAAHNAADARRQHAIALSRQLAAESLSVNAADPVVARRLAVAAWRVFPTSQANSAMATLLANQQQNGILPADASGVSEVALGPSGNLLASADDDGTVRLWNPSTGRLVRVLRAASSRRGVQGVAFSPSGSLLASADGDGTVRLWNPSTGRLVHVLPAAVATQGGSGVAFSADGKLLASADDATVRLWNPSTGRLVRALHVTVSAVNGGVFEVAFSPSSSLLASVEGHHTVQLWNPAIGRLVRVLHVTDSAHGVFGVAFSADGKLLASADGDGTVRLWNPSTGRLVRVLPADGGAQGVQGVAFSPSGSLLASAGGDGTVHLWNPATGRSFGAPINTASAARGGVLAIAYSPTGKLLASFAGGGSVQLWNPATGQLIRVLQTASSSPTISPDEIAFSPDGKLLASAEPGSPLRVWNTSTGQLVRVLGTPGGTDSVSAVAFSPKGNLLASAGFNGLVRLRNTSTGQQVRVLHPTSGDQGVQGVAFSPDGKLLATPDSDGTVQLWNTTTGQPVRAIHAATKAQLPLIEAAFSPDGKLLASADGFGPVRLWSTSTGRPLGILPNTDNGVEGIALSPSGNLLASFNGGTIQLWNLLPTHPVGIPIPADTTPGDAVGAVAFNPRGNLLASADASGTVWLWNVSAFINPYGTLCTDVGPPTRQEWRHYAAGEPQPRVC